MPLRRATTLPCLIQRESCRRIAGRWSGNACTSIGKSNQSRPPTKSESSPYFICKGYQKRSSLQTELRFSCGKNPPNRGCRPRIPCNHGRCWRAMAACASSIVSSSSKVSSAQRSRPSHRLDQDFQTRPFFTGLLDRSGPAKPMRSSPHTALNERLSFTGRKPERSVFGSQARFFAPAERCLALRSGPT
jgi:hypothetical protein